MTRSVAHTSEVDAFIGISSDSLLLVQDNGPRHDILFVVSTKSIIGWTIIRQNSIRIYFHQVNLGHRPKLRPMIAYPFNILCTSKVIHILVCKL